MAELIEHEGLLEQAVAAHEARDWARAESLYREAVTAGSEAAQFQLGGLLGDLDRDEEALAEYEKSAAQGDSDAKILWCLIALTMPGRREAAKDRLRALGDNGDPRAYTEFAFSEEVDGDLVSAEKWFRLAIDQGDDRGLLGLAILLSENGNNDDALPYFKLAVELDVSQARTEYGRELLLREDPEAAIPVLETAVELEEDGSFARLGSALCDAGEYDRAEALFTEALASGDKSVLVAYADLLMEFERFDEAHERLVEALKLDLPDAEDAKAFLDEQRQQQVGPQGLEPCPSG